LAWKSGTGEARRRVGRRRGRLPSLARQSLPALVMQSFAPAPGATSPWDDDDDDDDLLFVLAETTNSLQLYPFGYTLKR